MIPIHTPSPPDVTPLPITKRRRVTRRPCENFELKIGSVEGEGGTTVHFGIEREHVGGRVWGAAIDVHKEGAFSRSLLKIVGKLVSVMIQEGIPVERIASLLSAVQFEPSGEVSGHDAQGGDVVANATSILDALGQLLRAEDKR